jgi:RNA polymerase sigma-70 factor (ECF subfamily)
LGKQQHHRMHESDERLIEQVRASDEDAFRILFEKYQPILFRFVLQSLHDAETAHDLVQETFLRLWNHRASIQSKLPLLSYLFRICRNLVRDHARHHAVKIRLEMEIPRASPSVGDNPEESLQLSILEEKLSEVVRTKLPTRCQEIFLLSRMEGMSYMEISAHLGISVKTVENQITRALKIIRRHLLRYVQSPNRGSEREKGDNDGESKIG